MSSINIDYSPTNLRAGDSVTLSITSDSLDLNNVKVIWYVDGVIKKESNNKTLTINTKINGDKTIIRAIVQTPDGIIKENSIEISPVGVDLVIEPISYTLPFYKGKPLFVMQGKVKIVALPDIVLKGVKLLSKDLYFKWSKNGSVLGSNSGIGMNSIVVNSTIPVKDINIGLEILDTSGNSILETSRTLSKDEPSILFYENNPLLGVLYNKQIPSNYYIGSKEELNVIAKPFSFDFLTDTSNNASYSWLVNDNSVIPSNKINELILKQTKANSSGSASISLNISNNDKILQSVNRSFDIIFGQ
jgi:hypothetical protein